MFDLLLSGGNDVGELKRQADQEVAAAPAARRAVAVRNRLRNRLAQRVEHSDDEDERGMSAVLQCLEWQAS